jgi:hypothetical protein
MESNVGFKITLPKLFFKPHFPYFLKGIKSCCSNISKDCEHDLWKINTLRKIVNKKKIVKYFLE